MADGRAQDAIQALPEPGMFRAMGFHRGDAFSHCGHDAFQLVWQGGDWVVTGLAYTVLAAPCGGPPR